MILMVLGALAIIGIFWMSIQGSGRDNDPSVGWWSNYLKLGEKWMLQRERRKAVKDGNHAAVRAIDWMFGVDKESRRTHNKRRVYTDQKPTRVQRRRRNSRLRGA